MEERVEEEESHRVSESGGFERRSDKTRTVKTSGEEKKRLKKKQVTGTEKETEKEAEKETCFVIETKRNRVL